MNSGARPGGSSVTSSVTSAVLRKSSAIAEPSRKRATDGIARAPVKRGRLAASGLARNDLT